MDIKLLIGASVAAAGLICAGTAVVIGKNKQKNSSDPKDTEVMDSETEATVRDNDETAETTDFGDSKTMKSVTESTAASDEKINQEIEMAWRES